MKSIVKPAFLLGLVGLLSSILASCSNTANINYQDAWAEQQLALNKECQGLNYFSPEEDRAWRDTMGSSEKLQCESSYPDSGTQRTTCMLAVYKRNIRPVAYSQDAFDAMQERQRITTDKLDSGEIDKPLYDAEMDKVYKDYVKTSGDLRKNSAYAWAKCREAVTRRVIPPDYPYWLQLNQNLIDTASAGRKADEVKLPMEDLEILVDQLWQDFRVSANAEYQRMSAEAEHQNARAAAAWQQAFQNISQMNQENQGYVQPALGGKTGFYVREETSGFNKICYYNALGNVYTLNVSSTSLCPLTASF
jgi:hypothetical protein